MLSERAELAVGLAVKQLLFVEIFSVLDLGE